MRIMQTLTSFVCALAVLSLSATVYAQTADEAASADEHVAALKQNLGASQKNLKQYQWTETTVVSYKGEEKSSTTKSCSYDADGKVVKTTVSAPAEHKKKRGLRGKAGDHKKEEISSYMQSAVGLVMSYVPPDPAKIQACKDAGKMSVTVTEPGKRVKIDFNHYQTSILSNR